MMADERPDLPGRLSRRAMIIGGAMLVTAATAAARVPRPNRPAIDQKVFSALFPDRAGDWTFESVSGVLLPPSDALSDRLYDSIVTRSYADSSGHSVMLLVAYNNRQDGMLQIHRPEFCYPAGGYRLSPTEPVELGLGRGRTIPANAFSASSVSRDEQVVYWTRLGESFPRRWAEQRWDVIRANLAAIIPDGMLARASVVGADMESSLPLIRNFVGALRSASPPHLVRLLFGVDA